MKSTVNEIERKTIRNRRGKIYFAADFATPGTPKSFNKALELLHASGLLVRFAQDIYLHPKVI